MVWQVKRRELVADRESQGKRFLLSLAVALCVGLAPCVAIAEETQDVVDPLQIQDGTSVDNPDSVAIPYVPADAQALGEISQKLDKLNEVTTGLETVNGTMGEVSGKLDTLLLENADAVPEPVEMVTAANSTVTFSAYAHVSPTGTYATYAKNIVPKMGWNDDYVFMQDSSSSYVLFYGDIDYASSGTFTGTGCDYIRWYYSGPNAGYVVQRGNADVVANVGDYMVLSSLGSYPLLDDGITMLRQEVCFYALVTVLVYSLHCALGFTLRMHRG